MELKFTIPEPRIRNFSVRVSTNTKEKIIKICKVLELHQQDFILQVVDQLYDELILGKKSK